MALNVADISFDHDGRLIIDGWPLDATDRTSDPRFTDVVTLGHRNNVGIYGPTPALTHEDWSPGAGATQTDADGDFTVSVAGATQTLTIPSNYASRLQTEVPAQMAPVGVPVAYITRRADAFVGDGEDPEGVYCWLGWRYLRVLLTVPSACDVTCTVTYRELGSHNDNHLSDSTRQTEYTYTPGAQHTLVRTVAMAQGSAQPMLVDLAADTPLAIVESIELSFGATGDWSLSEPQLVLDPGDGEREAVTPHWCWKHFEHWAYAEGGISAVVDGQRCGIEWPDHNKPNTVERHLGGNFNTVIGAESGIDLTGAWPLSTYVGFIRDCADAWEVTYNTSADEAHLVDDEDARLCTLSCTDLCTVTGDDYEVTNPEVAIRVGIWTCATGLHYDWHVRHVVEGEAHGWLVAEEGGLPVRETGDFSLYRRELGSADAWVEVEALTSNGHGYWRTHTQVPVLEYDEAGAATLYEYGVGTEGAVVSLGRFAAREYDFGRLLAAVAIRFPFLLEGNYSRLYLTYANAGSVYWTRRLHGDATWATPEDTTLDGEAPAICYPRGMMFIDLLHGDATALAVRRGKSDANNWRDEGDALNLLRWPYPVAFRDKFVVLGYSGGNQLLARYWRESRELLELATVAASDESAGAVMRSGAYGYWLAAVPSGGDTLLYQSWRDGQTGSWTLVATLTDLLYPSLCDDGRRIFVGGYDTTEEQASCEVFHARDLAPYGAHGRTYIAPCVATRAPVVKQTTMRGVLAVLATETGIEYWRSWTDGSTWAKVEDIA